MTPLRGRRALLGEVQKTGTWNRIVGEDGLDLQDKYAEGIRTLLGGVLGAIDGLTALISAPEVAPQIMTIVLGSTFKGLVAGILIGLFARKVNNLTKGLIFGGAIGLILAFAIAAMPNPDGSHYWVEIMLPGTIVGLIVGYATQKYGRPAAARA